MFPLNNYYVNRTNLDSSHKIGKYRRTYQYFFSGLMADEEKIIFTTISTGFLLIFFHL